MVTSSPLRDPNGLFARAPELEPIAERVPAFRRAVEQGRPLDAYRALEWAHRLGRLGDQRDVAAALLARRRVFLKPLVGAPKMFTYNGIGTNLYGRADLDINDATYIATLFVVVFFVPIFPIASYLVRDGQGSSRRSWVFMARVPMGALVYVWQRLAALGVVGLIVAGAASAFEGYGHGVAYFVNGLDRPVSVQLSGGRATPVAAGGTAHVRTTTGKHTLEVRYGDRLIESGSVDVPHAPRVVAWNVLGAAPAYFEYQSYTAKDQTGPPKETPPTKILCGQSLIEEKKVDYPFTELPKTLDGPSDKSAMVVSHLGVANGGWRACVNYLWTNGETDRGAHLTLQIARATQATAEMMSTELESAVAVSPVDEGEAFAKELLSHDDSLVANRIYQEVLLARGERARVIAEYDARLAAKPSADAEYLALRVRAHEVEGRQIDAAVARYPQHTWLRRAQAYEHYEDMDFPGTVGACDALKGIDASQWAAIADPCVDALVAVGRGSDALDTLKVITKDTRAQSALRTNSEELAYRVAYRIGQAAPTPPDGEDTSIAKALFLRAAAGEPLDAAAIDKVKDPHAQELLRITSDARSNPATAFARIRRFDPGQEVSLPAAVQFLLMAEADRDDATADVARRLAGGFAARRADTVRDFVRKGVVDEDVLQLPLELRAALDFARSRRADVPAEERATLLAHAAAADVLHGPVSVAVAGWPPP